MLKLASDNEDEEVVCNVLFFFERLFNAGTEIVERMSVKMVYSVCALLHQGVLTYSQ